MKLERYMKESFIGNEVIPYMLDAIEQKMDITTKEKALVFMQMLAINDKHVRPVIDFLKHIDETEYKSLYKMVKEYEA